MDNIGILKKALVSEMVAVSNYRDYALIAKEPMLKSLFTLFASNENWHVSVLKRLIENHGAAEELNTITADIKAMKEKEDPNAPDSDKGLLEILLEAERTAIRDYEKAAGPVKKFPMSELQETFYLLAENEKLHEKMLVQTMEKLF